MRPRVSKNAGAWWVTWVDSETGLLCERGERTWWAAMRRANRLAWRQGRPW